MRAPSHIDFRTAVKMSQQAAFTSGAPKLTPLPSYQSQIVDECYSYTSSPEPELLFTPELESNGFAFSRGATPQTPTEPFGYHDPLPIVDDLDYLNCQSWSKERLVPVGLGFADFEMPMQSWLTPEPEDIPPMEQMDVFAQNADFMSPVQMQGSFDAASNTLLEDWSAFQTPEGNNNVPHAGAASSLLLSDSSSEGSMSSGLVTQGEWSPLQSQVPNTHINVSNMFTSAPYVPKMQTIPSNAPVWEDVFMSGSMSY